MLIIVVRGRQRQKECLEFEASLVYKFQASLGYMVKACLKATKDVREILTLPSVQGCTFDKLEKGTTFSFKFP